MFPCLFSVIPTYTNKRIRTIFHQILHLVNQSFLDSKDIKVMEMNQRYRHVFAVCP